MAFFDSVAHGGNVPGGHAPLADRLGLSAGLRAVRAWQRLATMTEAELQRRGLRRDDIPREVLRAITARD